MDTVTKRRFTGKLSNFNSKVERSLNKKALKAYLQGKYKFQKGFDRKGKPQYVYVPQEIE